MEQLMYILPFFGVLGLFYMASLWSWVGKQDAGESKMAEIAKAIQEGAMAFLNAEYRILGVFVVVAAGLLAVQTTFVENSHWSIAVAFVVGAVFSAVAGNIGMRIATKANVRTTQAARTSLSKALNVSFRGGMVMGLGVAGLAVFGLSFIFILLVTTFLGRMGGDAASVHTMEKIL